MRQKLKLESVHGYINHLRMIPTSKKHKIMVKEEIHGQLHLGGTRFETGCRNKSEQYLQNLLCWTWSPICHLL
jgi:hypothetical protein